MKLGGWGARALGAWLVVEEGWKVLAMGRFEPVLLVHVLGVVAGFLVLADGARSTGKRTAAS